MAYPIQKYLSVLNVPEDETRVPTANEPGDGDSLFRFAFGAYGWTKVDVFADDHDSAFEVAVEWLDDNAPGHLCNVGEAELKEAAAELGIDYDQAKADYEMDGEDGLGRPYAAIIEHAEADLTLIGHTTLKNGQYVDSEGFTFDEIVA